MIPLLTRPPTSGLVTRGLQGAWFLGGLAGGAQTVPIYRGSAGTLQLGATAGAEASDPGILNSGLSFLTDDEVRATTTHAAGDYTLALAAVFAGTGSSKRYATISVGGGGDFIYSSASGQLAINSNVGGWGAGSANLAVSTTSPSVVIITRAGNLITAYRMDTGTSVTVTALAGLSNNLTMFIGSDGSTGQIQAMTGHAVTRHNVVLTATERQRLYRWLKTQLSLPPYSLDVL